MLITSEETVTSIGAGKPITFNVAANISDAEESLLRPGNYVRY